MATMPQSMPDQQGQGAAPPQGAGTPPQGAPDQGAAQQAPPPEAA